MSLQVSLGLLSTRAHLLMFTWAVEQAVPSWTTTSHESKSKQQIYNRAEALSPQPESLRHQLVNEPGTLNPKPPLP